VGAPWRGRASELGVEAVGPPLPREGGCSGELIMLGGKDSEIGASHAKGFHLHVLLKPCVNLSIHTASDVRPPTFTNRQ
jgi:hypothetical protein